MPNVNEKQLQISIATFSTMVIAHILMLSLLIMFSSQYNECHRHRSADVEDVIKRYSREANLEMDEIKNKLFERKYAGKYSLQTKKYSKKLK